MDLKQLQYFVTIAEEGSISAAAQKLYMTQPPLSNQIKLLEQELQCTLFERGARRITLTDEGTLLYHRAISLLELSKVTKEELLAYSNEDRGTIRIGIVSSVVCTLATNWISGFSRKYPQIQFDIFEADTYQLIEKLHTSTIHFAILRTPNKADDCVRHTLARESMVAVGKPEFFPASTSLTLRQLAKQPVILYRRWERILMEQFQNHELVPNIICINEDARTTAALAETGMGVGLVPESALSLLKTDATVWRRISDLDITTEIELVYHPASYIPPCGELFLEYMNCLDVQKGVV